MIEHQVCTDVLLLSLAVSLPSGEWNKKPSIEKSNDSLPPQGTEKATATLFQAEEAPGEGPFPRPFTSVHLPYRVCRTRRRCYKDFSSPMAEVDWRSQQAGSYASDPEGKIH
jgi:hypothetical protein